MSQENEAAMYKPESQIPEKVHPLSLCRRSRVFTPRVNPKRSQSGLMAKARPVPASPMHIMRPETLLPRSGNDWGRRLGVGPDGGVKVIAIVAKVFSQTQVMML